MSITRWATNRWAADYVSPARRRRRQFGQRGGRFDEIQKSRIEVVEDQKSRPPSLQWARLVRILNQ